MVSGEGTSGIGEPSKKWTLHGRHRPRPLRACVCERTRSKASAAAWALARLVLAPPATSKRSDSVAQRGNVGPRCPAHLRVGPTSRHGGGRSSSRPFEDADVVGDRGAAHVEDAAERRVLGPACRRPRRRAASRRATCIETPVAPIGWPLALSPPEGFTGSLPSGWVQPSRMARAPWPGRGQAHRLVFDQLGDREAVVGLDEGEVVEGEAGLASSAGARPRRSPRT